MHLSSCFTYEAQIMFEMVLLTTGFGKFEFPPLFLFCSCSKCGKKCGKIQIEVPKCQKVREIQNCETVKKFGNNSNSSNPLGESTSADLDRMGNLN